MLGVPLPLDVMYIQGLCTERYPQRKSMSASAIYSSVSMHLMLLG